MFTLDEREQGSLAETLVLSSSSTLQVELLRFGKAGLPVNLLRQSKAVNI